MAGLGDLGIGVSASAFNLLGRGLRTNVTRTTNTDPQRDSLFSPQSRDPSDVLDHATSENASGCKLRLEATKKIPGEGFNRPWPPPVKMDGAVKANVWQLLSP